MIITYMATMAKNSPMDWKARSQSLRIFAGSVCKIADGIQAGQMTKATEIKAMTEAKCHSRDQLFARVNQTTPSGACWAPKITGKATSQRCRGSLFRYRAETPAVARTAAEVKLAVAEKHL